MNTYLKQLASNVAIDRSHLGLRVSQSCLRYSVSEPWLTRLLRKPSDSSSAYRSMMYTMAHGRHLCSGGSERHSLCALSTNAHLKLPTTQRMKTRSLYEPRLQILGPEVKISLAIASSTSLQTAIGKRLRCRATRVPSALSLPKPGLPPC